MENEEDEDDEADDEYDSRQDMKDMRKMMEFMIYKMKKISLNLKSVQKQVRYRSIGGARDFYNKQYSQSLAMPVGGPNGNATNDAYSGKTSQKNSKYRQNNTIRQQQHLQHRETMREQE
jgi:hypothetical protein